MEHLPDRFWWLRGVIGVLFGVSSIIPFHWLALTLPPSFPAMSNLALWQEEWQEFLLLGGGGVILVIWAGLCLQAASQSRRQFHGRLRAFQGNQEAMPLAPFQIPIELAPELSPVPLELRWRATTLHRRWILILYGVSLLVVGVLAVMGVHLALLLASPEPTHLPLLERSALLVLAVGSLLVFPLSLLIWFTRALPAECGKPYGITASREGLLYQPKIGRSRFLRWEEMRLFEIDTTPSLHQERCRLYGPGGKVEWRDLPPSPWVSLNMTSREYLTRQQGLLTLIIARTHLLPRAFEQTASLTMPPIRLRRVR